MNRKYEPTNDELRTVARWKFYKEDKIINEITKELQMSKKLVL